MTTMTDSKTIISNKYPESFMKKKEQESIKLIEFSEKNLSLRSSIDSRKDKYGNFIQKNKKIHKISFSDQFKDERTFVQVNKIQSYKNQKIVIEDERKCLNCTIL